jgi:hypothetical protein
VVHGRETTSTRLAWRLDEKVVEWSGVAARNLIICVITEVRRNNNRSGPKIQKAPRNMLQDAEMPKGADGMLNAMMMKKSIQGCHGRTVEVNPIVVSIQQEES